MVKKLMIALLALFSFAGMAYAKKAPPPVAPPPAPAAMPAVTPENTWVLELSTGGSVRILLRPDRAPGHIERIKLLTRAGFYDGLKFHRVIEGFMAQVGDPLGTGEGGSPLPDLQAEFNDLMHLRGAVAMARTDQPDTANSQFFICFLPNMRLDGKYTVFGRVISGMEFVDAIERGEPPLNPATIRRAWIESDGASAPRVPLVVPPVAAPVTPTP